MSEHHHDEKLATAATKRCEILKASNIEGLDSLATNQQVGRKFADYVKATSNMSIYQDRMKKIASDAGLCNNSFQWQSNGMNYSNLKSNFAENPINTNNWKQLVKALTKCSPTTKIREYKPIATRSSGSERLQQTHHSEEKIQEQSSGFHSALHNFNMQLSKHSSRSDSKRKPIKRNAYTKFVPPMLNRNDSIEENEEPQQDERLKNIDPKMVELIKSEIMYSGRAIDWNDIAGLEFAKTEIQEAVVWPMMRPDIFTGLRRPPKGILLFGPPGTGKTLIGKCVASQSKSTFFSISASSLTSKWIGDGEKMVRALFTVARCHQPAVVFIDEIDSLLCQRSDTEHESSRRIKTEFLVQLDGATTDTEERLLIIGATNRPQELDEAARRRLVKRLYIPLPELKARLQLVQRLISSERHELCEDDFVEIAKLTEGYSGADMQTLCTDAALGPIRSIHLSQIQNIDASEVRSITMDDFRKSLARVRTSVSSKDLQQYIIWDNTYGSGM